MPKQRDSPERSPSSGANSSTSPARALPSRTVMSLNMQALSAFEDEFLHSPSVLSSHAGMHSPAIKKPTSAAAAALDLCASTCNFEDFSRHFHLPLKAAAEKFGVRATAFKKRCRAIGIRHWPYRKVRSLKRSLQELAHAQKEAEAGVAIGSGAAHGGVAGGLSDKQRRQLSSFQKQLSTLLAPETYGVDPSGRLNVPAPFDDGDNDMDDSQLEDDDADSDSAYSSPRPSAAEAFDFGSSFRAAADANREMMMAMANAPSHLRTFRRQTAYHDPSLMSAAAFSTTLHAMPTMAHASSANSKLVFGWPDCYYFNEEAMAAAGRAGDGMTPMVKSEATTASSDEQDTEQGSPDESSSSTSPSTSSENQQDTTDFLTPGIKFEEVRSLRGDIEDDATFGEPAGSHVDYSSERFFDDVFLQISPGFGCLV